MFFILYSTQIHICLFWSKRVLLQNVWIWASKDENVRHYKLSTYYFFGTGDQSWDFSSYFLLSTFIDRLTSNILVLEKGVSKIVPKTILTILYTKHDPKYTQHEIGFQTTYCLYHFIGLEFTKVLSYKTQSVCRICKVCVPITS